MDYFRILDLVREPFSTSPDPDLFYRARGHASCLHQMEISIRLRRGLSVVVGEVGAGKTTICRQLLRELDSDENLDAHLMLDPAAESREVFLARLWETLGGAAEPDESVTAEEFKERLKKRLFQLGVGEGRTVVLLIDEGQKLHPGDLETLRELLNFETNSHKLLQIVVFAQMEFLEQLERTPNLADRINTLFRLGPLSFGDARNMIRHRLAMAGAKRDGLGPKLFTLPALWVVHRASAGYPRSAIRLCHHCVLAMIVQNKARVGWLLARATVRRNPPAVLRRSGNVPARVRRLALVGALAAALGVAGARTENWPEATETFLGGLLEKAGAELAMLSPAAPPALIETAADQGTGPAIDEAAGQGAGATSGQAPPPASAAAALPAPVPGSVPPAAAEPSTLAETRQDGSPVLLGEYVFEKGESLSGAARTIYGRREQALAEILRRNPAIRDPASLRAGDVVVLPALPTNPPQPRPWIVLIETKEKIEDVMLVVRAFRARGEFLSVLPFWSPGKGLRFAVCQGGWRRSEMEAQRDALTLADPLLRQSARPFGDWDKGTVFYAALYRQDPPGLPSAASAGGSSGRTP